MEPRPRRPPQMPGRTLRRVKPYLGGFVAMSTARAAMSWHRLPSGLYRGPMVVARISHTDLAVVPPFVECWALLDTGATHSLIDNTIAQRLGLSAVGSQRLALAGAAGPEAPMLPVFEVALRFEDYGFSWDRVRVSSVGLPGPFWMLLGMDLLDGTRLALECKGSERWLRWEPLR